jgi:hypothetical protein
VKSGENPFVSEFSESSGLPLESLLTPSIETIPPRPAIINPKKSLSFGLTGRNIEPATIAGPKTVNRMPDFFVGSWDFGAE